VSAREPSGLPSLRQLLPVLLLAGLLVALGTLERRCTASLGTLFTALDGVNPLDAGAGDRARDAGQP
jgi:hypothetical protein